jgi:hypothetical protein
VLQPYIPRDHDAVLAEVVAGLAEADRSDYSAARELGFLPLALTQAAAVIAAPASGPPGLPGPAARRAGAERIEPHARGHPYLHGVSEATMRGGRR